MSATAAKKKFTIDYPMQRRMPSAAAEVLQSELVRVSEPSHLCRVQAVTRALCRSIGLCEGEVFSAVIGVAERVHRDFIEAARTGDVEFSIVRGWKGLNLEVRVLSAPGPIFRSPSATASRRELSPRTAAA